MFVGDAISAASALATRDRDCGRLGLYTQPMQSDPGLAQVAVAAGEVSGARPWWSLWAELAPLERRPGCSCPWTRRSVWAGVGWVQPRGWSCGRVPRWSLYRHDRYGRPACRGSLAPRLRVEAPGPAAGLACWWFAEPAYHLVAARLVCLLTSFGPVGRSTMTEPGDRSRRQDLGCPTSVMKRRSRPGSG